MWWVWFAIGLFTGVAMGIFIFALMSVSRDPCFDVEAKREH